MQPDTKRFGPNLNKKQYASMAASIWILPYVNHTHLGGINFMLHLYLKCRVWE